MKIRCTAIGDLEHEGMLLKNSAIIEFKTIEGIKEFAKYFCQDVEIKIILDERGKNE